MTLRDVPRHSTRDTAPNVLSRLMVKGLQAILLPQVHIREEDNGALRAEWGPRSVRPLEYDREQGAFKRQLCSSVDGD